MRSCRGPTVWASRAACLVVLAVAALAMAGGCGRRGLHKVSGSVRFVDGAPLTQGRVVVDYGGDSGAGAWGRIRPDGSFTIGTLSDGDGMRAGTFQVAIRDAVIMPPGSEFPDPYAKPGPTEPTHLVDERFRDPTTSGLSFTVPDQTVWEIVVEKPPKR
jgi:hypothetical protein